MGVKIAAFVGLQCKVYAAKGANGGEEKKSKGTPKIAVEKDLRFDHYKACLKTGEEKEITATILRSHDHTMYTQTIRKVALSNKDDKRIILEDGISTLAYGHYRLG